MRAASPGATGSRRPLWFTPRVVELDVISWNVRGLAARGRARKAAELADRAWQVCLIQEATPDGLEEFAAAAGADEAVGAHQRLPDDVLGAAGLTYFCAVLIRGPARLVAAHTLDVPSPERALAATVDADGHRFTAASLALPPGVNWGPAKARQALLIARWLSERTGPVIFGIDANTPKAEHPDLAQNTWWRADEARLLGADRSHDARGVYRDHLTATGTMPDSDTDGPLAVSFERHGGRGRHVPCRYDAIYATPEWQVDDAGYHHDAGRAAGSDHGYVTARLRIAS